VTFQLIDEERAHHAVSRLCSVLNVSPQAFWAWKPRRVREPLLQGSRASRRRLEKRRQRKRGKLTG
jgi:hypothetical protein